LNASQKCRPHDDSREDFSDHFGLSDLDEKISEYLSKPHQEQEKKKHGSEIGVRHANKDAGAAAGGGYRTR
jgi:hypothetical protein